MTNMDKTDKTDKTADRNRRCCEAIRERYRSDPEFRKKVLARVTAWRKAHPDRVREHNRKYAESHREQKKARCARYFKAHKERLLAKQKVWYASLPLEQKKAMNRDRYLRRKKTLKMVEYTHGEEKKVKVRTAGEQAQDTKAAHEAVGRKGKGTWK